MGRLIYFMLTSLDGFIADGEYSWSAPNEEVMAALTADAAERGTRRAPRPDAAEGPAVQQRHSAGHLRRGTVAAGRRVTFRRSRRAGADGP